MHNENNREAWLQGAVTLLASIFYDDVPPVRVSVGWPGGRGKKSATIGQCWHAENAADGVAQIFVSPVLSDGAEVLAVLAHEMVHAVCGSGVGHRGRFIKIAESIGLEGPWTATTAGPDLVPALTRIMAEIGDYPHAALSPGSAPKKQTTRMLKLEAVECCGYVVRTTQRWIDEGLPACPHGVTMDMIEA